MEKRNVKVVVDYKNGTYDVIGLHNNEIATIHKPIRVIGKGGFSEDNFSGKSVRMMRKEMRTKLKQIKKSNPKFKYSRSLVRKVDPLIYKALEDWDSMAKTTHATDYLKTITQDFEWLESPELSDKEFEKKCQDVRRADLSGYGIDIAYNVGMFNTSKQLTFLDKARGIRFAKIQRRFLNAEVQNSLVLKPDYYLEEINQFVNDIEKLNDDKDTLELIKEKFIEIKKGNLTPDKIIERNVVPKEVLDIIQSVFAEIENERSIDAKTVLDDTDALNAIENAETLMDLRDALIRIAEKNDAKKSLKDKKVQERISKTLAKNDDKEKKEEENIFFDEAVKKRIRETLAKEEARKAAEEEARKIEEAEKRKQEDAELKRLVLAALGETEKETTKTTTEKKIVTKPKIEENKKNKKYKGNTKQRVRNHTGERTSLTEKQRKSMARKEKKEQNSHYNTQMRLVAEKEEKKRQAEERIAKFQEEKKLEEAKKIAEEEARKAEELARKTAEEEAARKAEEAKKAEELARKEAEARKREKVERWKRELKAKSDAAKNKKHISKKENKEKTLKNAASGTVKRRIQAEVRYWKRKLRSTADSIRNKKFKPMSKEVKKRIIAGAISVVALGLIITGSHNRNIDIDIANIPGTSVSVATPNVAPTPRVTQAPEVTPAPTPEATQAPEVTPAPTPEVTPAPEITPAPEVDPNEQISTGPGHSESESGENTTIDNPSTGENEGGSETIVETDEEKLERFRQEAFQMYQDALIIGETPKIGDILMDQTYCESPSGTGKVGYFKSHPDYKISHINIVTAKGWKVVRVEGKSLTELLAEYPEYVTYNIAFVDSKTGGGLGFVTQEQYENVVKNRINEIIDSRMDKNTDLDLDSEGLMK